MLFVYSPGTFITPATPLFRLKRTNKPEKRLYRGKHRLIWSWIAGWKLEKWTRHVCLEDPVFPTVYFLQSQSDITSVDLDAVQTPLREQRWWKSSAMSDPLQWTHGCLCIVIVLVLLAKGHIQYVLTFGVNVHYVAAHH